MARKTAGGLYLTALSAILGIVGFIAYIINTGTDYFGKDGVNPAVVGCLGAAIVLEIVLIVVGRTGTPVWADVLPVASGVLLMASTLNLLSVRVAGIASIMTFEGNASTRADMMSAIVAIACCLVAAIFCIIASFHDISREA